MRYSIIVPVYNRPDEVNELLESLTRQEEKDLKTARRLRAKRSATDMPDGSTCTIS